MNSIQPTPSNMINRPRLSSDLRLRARDGGFSIALALFTVLFISWFLFAADSADAAGYKGKTKGGSSITFSAQGNKVSKIRTVVPTLCLETTGNYSSRAGSELFQPVTPSVIGRTSKSKALQPAAMNVGAKATKNYEVTVKKRGKVLSGKLSLNYSFLIPNLYGAQIFICSGSTTFTAKPS